MSTEGDYSNFSGLPSCRPDGMPDNVTMEEEEAGGSGVIPSTFIAVFFTLICLMGVVGNALCFYVLCLKSSPRSTITVYILSLATADTVYILASPFYASTYFTNLWYFGDVGCRVISAVDVLTLNASTFTLTVMCLERYLAVVDPIKSLKCRSVSLSRVLSGVIWVLAMGLSLPMALSTELQECGEDGVVQESGCFAVWSDQDTKIYFTTLFIVAFVIPGVVLCAFYLRMLCKYWLPAGRPIGEVTSRATESRKKVAKMVSLILVVFWLCYLPFWILQMLMFHGHEVIGSSISYEALYYLRFVLQNLSYINACANPFLYTLLSDKYKAILKGILTMKGTPRHPVVHRTMTTHSSIELNSMRRSHVTDRSHVTTHNPSPMFGTPHVRRSFYTIRERSSSEENDAMNIRA
ncbi:urotensin-2 receptor-like [Branchiostoma lanceolatum]|uniref:urotensin-2 receptor-like n=1 Tax=Branchiostoma lanceolatum TaxID=7740 RepID=UPI003455F950